jgi:hypothetical protein
MGRVSHGIAAADCRHGVITLSTHDGLYHACLQGPDLLKFTVLMAATSQPSACRTVVAMSLPT